MWVWVLSTEAGEEIDDEMAGVTLELVKFVVIDWSQIATALEIFQERGESSAHSL